jgi:hypothetical protein
MAANTSTCGAARVRGGPRESKGLECPAADRPGGREGGPEAPARAPCA